MKDIEEAMTKDQAKRLWIHAQKLDVPEPFGQGAKAIKAAVEHLGYVQIDTINVIERCHHHILFNRIPYYQRCDLHRAQTIDKTIFEYWTHALSFVPTKDFHFFVGEMKKVHRNDGSWFSSVKDGELKKVLKLIQKDGALSIRDINDDVLVEKSHPWDSRKPSKKALQFGFHCGRLVVSERLGMLKKYEILERHFGWKQMPKAASEAEVLEYLLERSLRSQALVSLDSICHLNAKRKPGMKKLIDKKVRTKDLIAVRIQGVERNQYWMRPELLDVRPNTGGEHIHILSPFDPLIILRKRLQAIFDYEHRFEAYLSKEKRIFGYFALPVLLNGRIVAVLDLKTDRLRGKMLMQKWTWIGKEKSAQTKKLIEKELDRFEKFQLAKD